MLTRYQRFTQIDADILQECRRFQIPFFIVRSKSDIHISNVQRDDELPFEEARDEFVSQTRTSLKDNLRRYNLWDDSNPTESYIVAAHCIYDLMKDVEDMIQQAEREGRGRTQQHLTTDVEATIQQCEGRGRTQQHLTTDVDEAWEHVEAEAEVKKGGKLRREYIDEEKLHRALLQTAIDRRYGNASQSSPSSTTSAASAMLRTVAERLNF